MTQPRLLVLVRLALVFCGLLPMALSALGAPIQLPHGFQWGVVGYHIPTPGYRLQPEDFTRMRSIGITWVEMDYAWRLIEPQPGQFDFSYYDQLTQAAKKAGLGIMAKLGNGFNEARPTVPDWTIPLNAQAYQAALKHYAQAVTRRYAGRIDQYALENEGNLSAIPARLFLHQRSGRWPPRRILGIWKTLGEVVREADPQAVIILSLADTSLSPINGVLSWVARAQKQGIPFDRVGLQSYVCSLTAFFPKPACRALTAADIQQVRLGAGKEVVLLEVGYCPLQGVGYTPQRQADYLRSYIPLAIQGGASGVFVYKYIASPDEPDPHDNDCALLNNDRTPKPAWFAYGDIIRSLSAGQGWTP
jgi:hypothetical protein